MKPLFAIIFAVIGAYMIIFGLLPLRLGISMGLILVAIGALFLLCIPASYYILPRAPQVYRVLRAVVGGVLAFGAIIAGIAIAQIYSRANAEELPENSVVVVLGAGLSRIDHLTPSLTLEQRLDTAAALLDEREYAVCVVSGGQGSLELVPEAHAMKKYLVEEKGVDPARIIMEDQSRDTETNLLYSARLMRENGLMESSGGHIALVTSDFHEYRACHFADKARLVPHSLPAPVLWSLGPVYWLREALAVVLEIWLGIYS